MTSNSYIIHLNDSDFSSIGGDFKLLKYPGFVVILFHSSQCEHCVSMLEIQKKLPNLINGATFASLNLDENKGVIQKSKNSTLELTYVPYLVFFANGKPYMIYSGDNDLSDIKKFVIQVSIQYNKENKPNNNQQQIDSFNNNNNQQQIKREPIDNYGNKYQHSINQKKQEHFNTTPSTGVDQACAVGDNKCLQKMESAKRNDSCYVTLAEAYSSQRKK